MRILNGQTISTMMTAMMLSDLYHPNEEEPDWDFVKRQYDIIQAKKSDLSRKDRDSIVRIWEEHQTENEKS